MSRATNYALRITRSTGFGWLDAVRDVRDGAMSAARVVVTFAGCTALLSVAALASNESARSEIAQLLPRALLLIGTAEAQTAKEPAAPEQQVIAERTTAPDPRQKHVVQYLARRYRIADEAARMLVSNAFEIGQEKKLDPLLILSVVAIESGLNPFAASPVGAQGLMQVMTRVHAQRFVEHGGDIAALDPIANMKVGSEILHELISRGGSIERGLQLYVGAGNMTDDGGYGARVLGERARMQIAAAGRVDAAIASAITAAARAVSPPAEPKPAVEVTMQPVRLTPFTDAAPLASSPDQSS